MYTEILYYYKSCSLTVHFHSQHEEGMELDISVNYHCFCFNYLVLGYIKQTQKPCIKYLTSIREECFVNI